MGPKDEQIRWDRAADDYQSVFLQGISDYSASLLRFWQEEGLLRHGARVLDIGCGVGKYGSYLAALGCDVTLVDISGEMLRRAEANLAGARTPWAVFQCDFDAVTGREPVFAGGFDLAISTMSPAVHDEATVRKMSEMTRGWCFLARFCAWEQPYRDTLLRALGLPSRRPFHDLEGDCAAMLEAVRAAGYAPQVKTVPYDWADERTSEEMADYMLRNYFPDDPDHERLREETLRLARRDAGERGTVSDAVNTRVDWIYWNTGDKRTI